MQGDPATIAPRRRAADVAGAGFLLAAVGIAAAMFGSCEENVHPPSEPIIEGKHEVSPAKTRCGAFLDKLIQGAFTNPLEVANEIVAACPASSSSWFLRYHLLTNAGLEELAEAALQKAVEIDEDWSSDSKTAARLRLARLEQIREAGISEGALHHTMALPGVDFDVMGSGIFSLPSDHGGPTTPGKYGPYCTALQIPDLFGRITADFYVDPGCWESSGGVGHFYGPGGGGGKITPGGSMTYEDLLLGPQPPAATAAKSQKLAWGTVIFGAGAKGPPVVVKEDEIPDPGWLPPPKLYYVVREMTCTSNPNSDIHECRSSDAEVEAMLQKIADTLKANVVVTSGDRSSVPNGGSSTSLHLAFRAADFRVQGFTLSAAFDAIRRHKLIPALDWELIWHRQENGSLLAPHLHLGHYAQQQASSCSTEGAAGTVVGSYHPVQCALAASDDLSPQRGYLKTVLEDPTRCGKHRSCGDCMKDECGWCTSTAACVEGTVEGSPFCASGWMPFAASCTDRCQQFSTCDSCGSNGCGWCRSTQSCYSSIGVAPSSAVGKCDPQDWVAEVASCQPSMPQEGAIVDVAEPSVPSGHD